MDLWSVIDEYGEAFAILHSDVVLDAMDELHYFHNAKTNDKQVLHIYWSMSHQEQADILYDYAREHEDDERLEELFDKVRKDNENDEEDT